MTVLEEFVLDYEREEEKSDMHFSPYFIPNYYQEENSDVV